MKALVLVVATGCFVSPVMHFGGGKSPTEAQHETLAKVTPPALVVDSEWTGEVSVAKIRVWADDDYRAQNVHWQQAFQNQLDYANEVLAAQFGVRLVADYRVWNRHAPGATLDESLGVLARQDPGDDVLVVVGLTSSLGLVAATFEQLGYAEVPGRHLVVRGYADVEERKVFDRAFHDLGVDERAALYQARRRHKTAAVLLHELAHDLGARHQDEPDTLMNPQYSDHSASFDRASHDVILATLDQRIHRAARRPAPPPVPHDTHPTLVIAVDASGRRLVGGNPVDDSTLDGLLRLSFDDDHETAIVVKLERSAPQRAVTEVIERAKAVGLQRVSIVTGD